MNNNKNMLQSLYEIVFRVIAPAALPRVDAITCACRGERYHFDFVAFSPRFANLDKKTLVGWWVPT